MRALAWLLLACVATVLPVVATLAAPVPAVSLVEESAIDRRAHAIADQLRCLVCQGQTVADSNSSLAADMRARIREKLAQGWSDQQIRDYFVQRYGDFVLYRPPLETATWALWFGPLVMLMAGLTWLVTHLRRRARQRTPTPLSPQDVERARTLLAARKGGGGA